MVSKTSVSSDLFDEVYADEQPAGNWQEDSRFPKIAETVLNAMMEGNQKHIHMTQCVQQVAFSMQRTKSLGRAAFCTF